MEQQTGLEVFCSAFDLTGEQIDAALKARDRYIVRYKRKRSGGFREYVVVPPELTLVQDRLRRRFDEHYAYVRRRDRLMNIVHGCVTDREPFTNALRHRDGRFFYHCDLKNAFGQVTSDRLRGLLAELPLGTEVIELVIKLVTFRGAIPQGASTSPVLFNWACRDMDIALKQAIGEEVAISRYVDDLDFSAEEKPQLDAVISEIDRIIDECGYIASARKSRRRRLQDGAVPITGLAINYPIKRAENNQPCNPWCDPRVYDEIRLPRKRILKYRVMLHEAAKGKRSQSQVEGSLGWVRHVYRGELPYILRKPYQRYRQAVREGRVPLKKSK